MSTSSASLEAQIALASSIPKEAFGITAGLFYGVAVFSVLARGLIRFITRQKLALDDYLLFLAFAFLTAATGLVYWLIDGMYLATGVANTPALIFELTPAQINTVLNESLNQDIFLALAWTATFLVKFSFLAFFRQLIRNVTSIKYYHWSIVGLTILSWMFLTSEAFILCSVFGIAAIKCLDTSKNTLYLSMTGLVTGLDALTDILIVSIPTIILYRTRMHTSQKLSLGIFLCLSLTMVCLAIIRASKIHGATSIDIVWEFYWQYLETVLAVIMGSLTVVRNLHVHNSKTQSNTAGASGTNASISYSMRILRRINGTGSTSRHILPVPLVSAAFEPSRKFQAINLSTLVEDDSSQLIAKDLHGAEPRKSGIHVDVEHAQERSEQVFQESPGGRVRVWDSLEGNTLSRPSVTTVCIGNNTKRDEK